ncbi:hypothetical protein C6Y45_11030 [Alkalicoccus saliphilus]|uniref:Uncharacterized protein n=1 Tax=Alkalicoccus saliphilus TaxID=200989 RepID=A0A2T4U4Z1_9BACI|nr:hypothetical protein C6Y45_11030 [Alkalicoccus saliphilus]
MELAEAGPLGKPLRGNESERPFFYFQGSLILKVIFTAYTSTPISIELYVHDIFSSGAAMFILLF